MSDPLGLLLPIAFNLTKSHPLLKNKFLCCFTECLLQIIQIIRFFLLISNSEFSQRVSG